MSGCTQRPAETPAQIDMDACVRAVARALGPPTPGQIARLGVLLAGALPRPEPLPRAS